MELPRKRRRDTFAPKSHSLCPGNDAHGLRLSSDAVLLLAADKPGPLATAVLHFNATLAPCQSVSWMPRTAPTKSLQPVETAATCNLNSIRLGRFRKPCRTTLLDSVRPQYTNSKALFGCREPVCAEALYKRLPIIPPGDLTHADAFRINYGK